MKIEQFCEKYNLGRVLNVSKLAGGFMHKMFKVETIKDVYAIKVLNQEVMRREGALNNFLVSEEISNYANSNGIKAAVAIKIDGNYVTEYEDNHYMVFKFVDGKVLKDDNITIEHCRKMGNLLARLHSLDYKILGLCDDISEDHFFVDWEEYVNNENFKKMKYKDEYLNNYKKYYSLLRRCVERYNESNEKQALCHCDMDPKNVMWVGDEPIIIDWESARVANPLREVIEDALCWSGFLSNNFSEEKFKVFIEEYTKVYSIKYNIYSLICGNLIGRFGWLDYNLKRSLGIKANEIEEIELASNEVSKSIDEINRYIELIPVMYRIICDLKEHDDNEFDSVVEKIINSNEMLYGLGFKRVNSGFTNTIYKVGKYILRLCTDVENEYRFKREIELYSKLKTIKNVPRCVLSDTTKKVVPYYYEVIDFIDGNTLYEIWYKLDEVQREELVKKIVEVVKEIHMIEVEEYDFCKYIKDKLISLNLDCDIKIDMDRLLSKCDVYFKDNKFGFIHNDLHFDNFIYDGNDLYLLDFERCMAAPIDYDLRIFNRYNEEPWLWASYTTDMLTIENDYNNFMNYFISNYAELNEISYLEERLNVYKMMDYLENYKDNRAEEKKDRILDLLKKVMD